MKNKNINNKNRKNIFRFEVANLVTEARYYCKLTQAQLAEKMNTQQPSIARVESGSILPSLSFLEKMAESIGTYLVAPKFGFMEDGRRNVSLGTPFLFSRASTGELFASRAIYQNQSGDSKVDFAVLA